MASNRFRSKRNVSNRLVSAESRLSFLTRRPTPRKLADNFIFTNNVRREAIVEPLIGVDAISNEKIQDGAVDTDQIEMDAINGKNITSSNITDSNISNSTIDSCEITNSTFDTIEGANFIVTDAFDMTNGELKQVTITDDSLLEGVDVVLSGVTLEGVFADTITSEGSLLLNAASDVVLAGTGFIVSTGGAVMTMTDTNFGISSGAGFILGPSAVEFGVGWQNFLLNGVALVSQNTYIDDLFEIYDEIAALQTQIDGKASSGHSH